MTKAENIITDALIGIGQQAPGESLRDSWAQISFRELNRMIDQWSNEPLACFAFLTQSVALQNNKYRYTIGPSADIDAVRPLRIEQMYVKDTLGNTYPVTLLSQQDWNLIFNLDVQSQVPTNAFYDSQDPIATINVWPTPIQPLYTLYWTSYLQLNTFPSLTTEVSFPLGYEAMLTSNLMVRLCKCFGKVVTPDIRAEADEARGAIKRKNIISQPSSFDREIVSRSYSTYDVRTDSYVR